MTISELALNLSFILHPCVLVAAMVVSDMNERLSPKKAPPTTIAVMNEMLVPVECASPAAIGTSATMVPTLVPIEMLIKQAARNKPASNILSGSIVSIRLTVASMAPIALADDANEPARINIQSISIILLVLAPLLKVSMRVASVSFLVVAMA